MLLSDFQSDMMSSLKKGDRVRVDTLRFLISHIRNFAIAKYGSTWETSLKDEDILDVIKKQVKSHKESILAYEKAGRQELADKEIKEMEILSAFLPNEISDDEIKNMLKDIVAGGDPNTLPAGRQDFGLLMKSAMTKVAGKADGGRVSGILKQMILQK